MIFFLGIYEFPQEHGISSMPCHVREFSIHQPNTMYITLLKAIHHYSFDYLMG